MAIDTAHHRLFSGCRSGVMAVSDYQAGKVVATVPIGTGVDGAGYDAGVRRRVRVERRRHADRDSSGRAGSVSRRADRADGASGRATWDSIRRPIASIWSPAKFGRAAGVAADAAPVLPGSFTLMVIERRSRRPAEAMLALAR